MFDPKIPTYLSVLFLIAILFPIFMIARLVKNYSSSENKKHNSYSVISFYIGYLSLVSIACFNGIFDVPSLPPRIILITTLPLLLLLMVFVFQTTVYKEILTSIPLEKLISLHIFRVIGSFFLILMFLELLPKPIGILAGCGDLITALSSLYVAHVVKKKKSFSRTLVAIWNTFGFVDILVTFATAFVLTKLSLETGSQGVEVLATFPFCFIPAFAPATIIFLHFSIYKKLLFNKS